MLLKEFVYNACPNDVWDALTDPAKMRVWYFPQLKSFQPAEGYKFEFDDREAAFQKEWVVTKVVPKSELGHSWTYKEYPGYSEVCFKIIPENNQTRLRVTHAGLESFPDESHFKRERFEQGWDNLLGKNLKKLLES